MLALKDPFARCLRWLAIPTTMLRMVPSRGETRRSRLAAFESQLLASSTTGPRFLARGPGQLETERKRALMEGAIPPRDGEREPSKGRWAGLRTDTDA